MRITVVTPSYNQGEYIEQTILSVLRQGYSDLEYFVIDGGSKDNTVDVLRKYDYFLDYWVSEKDSGQSNAINKGLKKATGDILCWINSDDILLRGALNAVAEYFAKHRHVVFLEGNTVRIDSKSNIIGCINTLGQKKIFSKNGIFNISQQSMFWRRKIHDKIGYLDERFHAEMDKEFIIRCHEEDFKFGYINKYLGAIRIHEKTKTTKGGEIWLNDKKLIRNMYGGRYDDLNRNLLLLSLYFFNKLMLLKYPKSYLLAKCWNGRSVYSFE